MDNKLKIINYLGKNAEKSFTMHELSELLKIPYASFYRTVKAMSDLIVQKKAGKATLISLNLANTVIRSYLSISSEEEKKSFKNPIIKKIANELETKNIVLLFGSYAKNAQTEKSDIDFMIINKDGNKDISFSIYELLHKKKINPIFITESEFSQMLKEKEENVGKQALANHIILNNPEQFWNIVKNAI